MSAKTLHLGDSLVGTVADLAQRAQQPITLTDVNPRTKRVVIDGTVHEFDVPPEPRKHLVDTLEDIETAVKAYSTTDDSQVSGVSLFICEERVVALLEDTDRLDRVTLPLIETAEFQLISLLRKKAIYDQRGLLRLLRVDLKRVVTGDIVQRIQAINFEQIARGENYIAPGAEKMGKSITAQVNFTGGALPEILQLSVPVYENHGLTHRYPMIVSIEVDVTNQRFELQTLPGEVETVLNGMAAHIQNWLTDHVPGATVLCGRPE